MTDIEDLYTSCYGMMLAHSNTLSTVYAEDIMFEYIEKLLRGGQSYIDGIKYSNTGKWNYNNIKRGLFHVYYDMQRKLIVNNVDSYMLDVDSIYGYEFYTSWWDKETNEVSYKDILSIDNAKLKYLYRQHIDKLSEYRDYIELALANKPKSRWKRKYRKKRRVTKDGVVIDKYNKLNTKQIEEIIKLRESGISLRKIEQITNVSFSSVRNILNKNL